MQKTLFIDYLQKGSHHQWTVICQLPETGSKAHQDQIPRKTDKGLVSSGQCFSTQVLGFNGCCAWLWIWNGWSSSPPDLITICSPTWKNTWLGTSITVMMTSYLLLMTFLINRMNSLLWKSDVSYLEKKTMQKSWNQCMQDFTAPAPLPHSQPKNFSAHPHTHLVPLQVLYLQKN